MRKPAKTAARRPRIRNPVQTRARLLQATVELLGRAGPDGVSLKEAAQIANVSRGVAYQHFTDRDHLLREAKDWIMERLLQSVQDSSIAAPGDVILHTARLVLQNRDATALLMSDAIAGRELLRDQPLNRVVQQMLKAMQSSGDARADIDVEILSYIFIGMTSTLVMLSRLPDSDPEQLAQRFANELSNFMRLGIYAPATAKKRSK